MRVLLIFFISLASFFTLPVTAQQGFERGYFIKNGKKTDCLIKATNRKNNPKSFKYRISEDTPVISSDHNDVTEYGLYDKVKYIAFHGMIDRSSDQLRFMSKKSSPEFSEEDLFLEVLLEGHASLYRYRDDQIQRFFFKIGDSEIEQLIYKLYKTVATTNGVSRLITVPNSSYKLVLGKQMKCGDNILNIPELAYTKNDLINFFLDYNDCLNSPYTLYEGDKYNFFNLTVRPGLRTSEFGFNRISTRNFDYDYNGTSFSLGIETEFTLPYGKRNLGIIFEPSYHYFKGEDISELFSLRTPTLSTIDYSIIELYSGIRYHIRVGSLGSVFLDLTYIKDIVQLEGKINFDHESNSITLDELPLNETGGTLGFGLGIGHKRFSMQFRHLSRKDLLEEVGFNESYRSFYFTLGYQLL